VISQIGTGPLHAVNNMMQKGQYIQLLDNFLFPKIKEWHFHAGWSSMPFCQSCEVIYTVTMLKVLEWPGNSRDMNPIKNIWE
jgi:hypothetical protein